jgi:proteasome lid subunit RPN8/RPN11
MTSWQTPLCPFTIGFAAEKLDEIRIAVVDSFYKVPRGGLEIGGVLYGKRMEGWLLITDFRKIETEYLTGPSFDLSEDDRTSLRNLLAETQFEDPQVIPVGWFHSHTRSGIYLSEKDLELYREFFPEPWQVALVLRPERLGPVQGGYFFRAADGQVKADSSVLEFSLMPTVGDKSAARAAQETVAPKRISVEPAVADRASARTMVAEPVVMAPAVAEALPVVNERPLFSWMATEKTPAQKRLLLVLMAMLAVASCAGYWVAAAR